MKRPEVCILPVAGLSTRNLPATKVLHKGFLTLHSKPIIQYAVDACAEIGIKEIVFIYSDQSCKYLFEKYFAPYPWLENHLKEKNKLDMFNTYNGNSSDVFTDPASGDFTLKVNDLIREEVGDPRWYTTQ